jgi:hypothetical protein
MVIGISIMNLEVGVDVGDVKLGVDARCAHTDVILGDRPPYKPIFNCE